MFQHVFSTSVGTRTLIRLGLSQLKSNVYVPANRYVRQLVPEVYSRRHFGSLLSVNSQARCPSCQTLGQLVFCRGYTNDSRGHQSAVSYIVAVLVFMVGAAYAGVPLYRMICQVSTSFSTLYVFFAHCSDDCTFTYVYAFTVLLPPEVVSFPLCVCLLTMITQKKVVDKL